MNYHTHSRHLLRIRRSTMPHPPTKASEVAQAFKNVLVTNSYSRTKHIDNEYYFYKTSFECEQFGYILFASDHVIDNIKTHIAEENREFLMDATFKICPFGTFYQLLIIYIGYCGMAFPFAFALMSRKTQACNEHLFRAINDIFPLNGKCFMTDYEIAMRNGLEMVYPNMIRRSCWFHFCQAVKKSGKISQIGRGHKK